MRLYINYNQQISWFSSQWIISFLHHSQINTWFNTFWYSECFLYLLTNCSYSFTSKARLICLAHSTTWVACWLNNCLTILLCKVSRTITSLTLRFLCTMLNFCSITRSTFICLCILNLFLCASYWFQKINFYSNLIKNKMWLKITFISFPLVLPWFTFPALFERPLSLPIEKKLSNSLNIFSYY